MAGSDTGPGTLERLRYGVDGLTALMGLGCVFALGFLVGRVTEPAPGLPAGVPVLAWFAFVLLVGALLTPLVKSAPGRPGRSRLAPLRPSPNAESALELFPREEPPPDPITESEPAQIIKIAS